MEDRTEATAIEKAIATAAKLESGVPYLLFLDRSTVSNEGIEQLRTRCGEHNIELIIVRTSGEPFPSNVGLYKLEKPNGS